MNFTGERVIPGEVDADLFNEHWTRYLFARGYVSGKKILDVACGSGYGSALLGETAARVVGADISRDAVEYARSHYASPNTQFIQADCLSLPFPSANFDLVIAFEIIEHIGDATGFLNELRRVLAPDGILLISTPNRLYYTEDRGEVNPFHEREFSYPEFSEMLRGVFPHCSILLENHVAGLLVADSKQAGNLTKASPSFHQQDGTQKPSEARQREQEAYYMIALCSAQPLPTAQPLFYLPSSGNVLRERETHIHHLEEQLVEARQERDAARARIHQLEAQFDERTQWAMQLAGELEESNRWAQDLDRRLAEKDAYILQLQADYESKVQWATALNQEVDKARSALEKLQQEFEDRTAWALRLDKELNERIADLRLLYGSRWYRVGKNLRLSPVPASDQPPNNG
ncbi:MAG: methyltransferase domain-containing protein [Acidobacteria bacterium]|nr:methyltransferase domain-containing protein [Acidobacteriota bacterium]